MATTSLSSTRSKSSRHLYAFSTGTVTIAGTAGSIDSITVGGVEIMSAAENFDTDSDTTATAVASNITSHTSSPDYNAAATGSVITITPVIKGSTANNLVVKATTTTMTAVETNMIAGAGDGATQISETANLASHISVSGVVATEIVTVEGKLHPDDVWHELDTVEGSTNTQKLITVDPALNFVRCRQSTGTGTGWTAYDQRRSVQ